MGGGAASDADVLCVVGDGRQNRITVWHFKPTQKAENFQALTSRRGKTCFLKENGQFSRSKAN